MAEPFVGECRIELKDGARIRSVLSHDGHPDGQPTVILLGEIWGANRFVRDLGARLAELGIVSIGPDPYRGASPPADDAQPAALHASFSSYDDVGAIRDLKTIVGTVKDGGLGFRPGPIYAWGFCMGGRFAHHLAAFDGRIAGAINCYGRVNFERHTELKPFNPLDVAGMVAVPYLGLFAGHDSVISHTDVATLRSIFERRGVTNRVKLYRDVHHGFFNPLRSMHDPEAAADLWREATALVLTGKFA